MAASLFSLAGCEVGSTRAIPAAQGAGLQGSVHGGRQPIAGATVQLYAVGQSGPASAATPLLANVVQTDSKGQFSLSGYSCPSAARAVYLVSVGGNPGLFGRINSSIALMAALGTCGQLAQSTSVTINEVTTVGTIWALAPYIQGYAHVGADASSSAAFAAAWEQAAEMVDPGTGTAPGSAPADVVPVAKINSLANILAGCVNSAGGTAGDGSVCGQLFAATTADGIVPTDTVAAALNMERHPSQQVAKLFDLAGAITPFEPQLTAIPSDLSLSPAPLGAPTSLDFPLPLSPPGQSPNFKTWYVRADGGTRYTNANPTGRCNGQADAADPGSGVNQPCAFFDERLLWTDPFVYNKQQWVVSGGDTVIIDQGTDFQAAGVYPATCPDGTATYRGFGCGTGHDMRAPSIPSGLDAAHPTRILGRNYANCSANEAATQDASTGGQPFVIADPTKTSVLWGGGSAVSVFDVTYSQHVLISCIHMTTHTTCKISGCGDPNLAAGAGIYSGNVQNPQNNDITLTNVIIDGFSSRAIQGNCGGLWTTTNLTLQMVPQTPWDFDPGNGNEAAQNCVLVNDHLSIMWGGFGKEYPAVHAIPIAAGSGYDDLTGGDLADGMGTPIETGFVSEVCNDCRFAHNTQDGQDLGHWNTGTVVCNRCYFYGNEAGTFKIGPMGKVLLYSSIININCMQMTNDLTNVAQGYNAHLADFCRAYDGLGLNFLSSNRVLFYSESSSGTTMTGQGFVNSSFPLAVGDQVYPASQGVANKRTIIAVNSDASATLSAPFLRNANSEPVVKYLGGTSTSQIAVVNSTIIGYIGSFDDSQCMTAVPQIVLEASQCKGYNFTWRNNVMLGIADPNVPGSGGSGSQAFANMQPTDEDYNLFYGMKYNYATGAHDVITSPLYAGQPAPPLISGDLELFNYAVTSASPLRGAGAVYADNATDFYGNPWAFPRSIGALEFGSTPHPK